MPKDNEGSKGKGNLLAGLIGGAIVGAAAAMMLSPKTGKENRQIVKESIAKGKESIAKGKERIAKGKERIAKGVDKIRKRQDSRDEEKV